MRHGWSTGLGLLLLAGLLLMSVGCQGPRVREERDALYSQNEELQGTLTTTRDALDRAEADRDRLRADMSRLQGELAARPKPEPIAPAPVAPPVRATAPGFGDIPGVETVPGRGTMTARIPGDVLFAPGSADLREPARRTLDQVANAIKRQYPRNQIRVEGHTDTDPIRKSRWRSNQELSEARARAVQRYLESRGVEGNRLSVVGHGASRPRQTKAQSRRVEIVVVTG